MFALSVIEHALLLPPQLQHLPLNEAIQKELERIFLDKVISGLGLCISVYDIRSVNGGHIVPGDGASTYQIVYPPMRHGLVSHDYVYPSIGSFFHITSVACIVFSTNLMNKVVFRLVMFRPFVGEILIGKIQSSDANGLQLSLGFFNDIRVPVHLLLRPYKMTEDNKWAWVCEGEDYILDLNEEIIFRVHSINYPSIPVEQEKDAKPFAPMEVTGDIFHDGLGLLSWWYEDTNEE